MCGQPVRDASCRDVMDTACGEVPAGTVHRRVGSGTPRLARKRAQCSSRWLTTRSSVNRLGAAEPGIEVAIARRRGIRYSALAFDVCADIQVVIFHVARADAEPSYAAHSDAFGKIQLPQILQCCICVIEELERSDCRLFDPAGASRACRVQRVRSELAVDLFQARPRAVT